MRAPIMVLPLGHREQAGMMKPVAWLLLAWVSGAAWSNGHAPGAKPGPHNAITDGDTVFALATGTATGTASVNQIGGAAADALSRAIMRALMAAEGIHTATCNVNSYCELFPSRCTR